MIQRAYRFRFDEGIDLEEAQQTLLLARLAVEAIFGRTRVLLDARWSVDPSINVIVVDASTPMSMGLCLIFAAFVSAEFGAEAVDVRRVESITTLVVREVQA